MASPAERHKLFISIEQRGKDEAEIAAKSLADEMGDKIVSGSLTQQCQLREETAMLLESVR